MNLRLEKMGEKEEDPTTMSSSMGWVTVATVMGDG